MAVRVPVAERTGLEAEGLNGRRRLAAGWLVQRFVACGVNPSEMKSQGVSPLAGSGDGDRWAMAIGTGRAFVIGSIGTAVAVAGWAALFELPALMLSFGALVLFALPPLLAVMVGAATARWGGRTIWAAIAGALGGWLAFTVFPHLWTLVVGRVDPDLYPYWLIAGTAGVLAYSAGCAAGWWLSTR